MNPISHVSKILDPVEKSEIRMDLPNTPEQIKVLFESVFDDNKASIIDVRRYIRGVTTKDLKNAGLKKTGDNIIFQSPTKASKTTVNLWGL